jgi:hypothetical protein
MSDLGLQPREERNQPDRLPAEKMKVGQETLEVGSVDSHSEISNLTWFHEYKNLLRIQVENWNEPERQRANITDSQTSRLEKSKFKILGSECQTSGTYSKTAKQTTKTDNCLCFLNYLAYLRPAADRVVSILSWVVSLGRSYGFLWAGSIIQENERMDNPTPTYSPVSDRRRLTALVEVHWARRVQAPMPQISWPN